MAEKKTVLKQSIKHKGYWKFTELYNFCFDFLKDEGFTIKENSYIEKIESEGKEITIEWEADKDVTDYFKYIIEVKWHILRMKDAEVERDGKKETTNKGEVKISIDVQLEKDPENRWEAKPMYKFMRSLYERYIIRTTVDNYEDRLKDIGKKFVDEIKAFLQLEGR